VRVPSRRPYAFTIERLRICFTFWREWERVGGLLGDWVEGGGASAVVMVVVLVLVFVVVVVGCGDGDGCAEASELEMLMLLLLPPPLLLLSLSLRSAPTPFPFFPSLKNPVPHPPAFFFDLALADLEFPSIVPCVCYNPFSTPTLI